MMFIPNAAALAGGRARDTPETSQPECGARNIVPQQQFRFPSGELPGSGELVGFDGSPCGCQDEQHGEVGGGVGEDAGGVADDDVVSGCGCYVDVVVADGVIGDSGYLGLREQMSVEEVAELGDDDGEISRPAGGGELSGVWGRSRIRARGPPIAVRTYPVRVSDG